MMSGSTVEAVQDTASPRWFRNPLNPLIEHIAKKYGGDNWKELERFLRFACVGISGAVVDLGLLTILQATRLPPARSLVSPMSEMIGYDPGVSMAVTLDLNVALATTIAFIAAVISNFIWTALWVYPDSRARTVKRQLLQFAFISVIGWIGRTLWITLAYQMVGRVMMPLALPLVHLIEPTYAATAVSQNKLGTLVAQLIAMGVVMLWNFFANRHWTFNDV